MAVIDRLVANAQAMSTTVLTDVAAGSYGHGPTLAMAKVDPIAKTLAARVLVEAETNTITLTPVWQVSNDGSAWVEVYLPNSAAYVVMQTGTAGDEASVTRVIAAPDAVFAFRYARCSILVGVTAGTANDKYSVAYNYVRV